MAFLKYLLPALAATQLVFADSKCGDTTVETQSDADAIANCKTLKGKVNIKSTFSQGLSLNGIEEIEGDLMCESCPDISSISADSLSSIGGNFTLTNVTSLTDLNMPQLTSIGKIKFDAVPRLTSLSFDKGIGKTNDVTILNTGLTSLSGFAALKQVGELNIQANPDLKTIELSDLKNASGTINLSFNKDSLEVKFPNLGTSKGINFRNVSSIEIPSLEKVDGEINVSGSKFKSFFAPNLTSSGDIGFKDNSKLTNITMNNLKTVDGGFRISRNDELDVIDLGSLLKVLGAVDFSGTFSTLKMDKLENVQGRVNIQSTNGKFKCATFRKMSSDNVIKGKLTCREVNKNPKSADGKSGTSSSSSGSSSSDDSDTTTGAAAINGIATPAVGVAAFFYALAQLV